MDRLRTLLENGTSVIVGAVDADGVPACCRGIALRVRDDGESVTVFVPVATSQEIVANVATNRRLAIVCSEPISHQSIQIKGVTHGVRLAAPADEAFVRDKLEQFAGILDTIGLPRRVTRSLAHWPAYAIEVSIEQLFDQTPGPKAGTVLT